ncbi:MAG: pyridoxal phosphate-dependent aminotransferase family protein [Bacteroidia bacterium]|nr:pyridoxal phosphate-dependent aminotransferase family protein [Bacteroidia bacterium]MCZ2277008.1 pyridoxal phosphate-dependent aminotransferase family protein [Bacteroidia bacterium]
MDIFHKCETYTTAREVMKTGWYPYFIPFQENDENITNDGQKNLIMFGSNNYLGLTTHPEVKEAAIEAIRHFGTSCTGSRFLNGTLKLHEELEHELAKWLDRDAALVFSTGMQTNLGVISSICERNDVIVIDKHAHASLIDGSLLSRGSIKRFRHNDLADLERVLSGISPVSGKLIVIDGVYSMEGDIAPLPEIMKIANKWKARVLVDDAHSTGVLGNGKGTEAHFHNCKADIITSTFSKSFSSLGGFIAGSEDVVHYIKHNARSMIFSASLAPPNVASALQALKIMQREPERIHRVNQIAERVRKALKEMGFNTGYSETPIIPIYTLDNETTLKAWRFLYDEGIFVNAVLSPAVPEGLQLLRTSYMATHTDSQIDFALDLFNKLGKKFNLIKDRHPESVRVRP